MALSRRAANTQEDDIPRVVEPFVRCTSEVGLAVGFFDRQNISIPVVACLPFSRVLFGADMLVVRARRCPHRRAAWLLTSVRWRR